MQSGDSNLCKDIRKANYFQEKSEKKRNFLPKSFADTEKSRTFASSIRQRGYSLSKIITLYTDVRSLKYLHFGCACRHVLNTPNKPYHKGTLMILYSVSIIRFVFPVKVKKRKSGCMLIAVVLINKMKVGKRIGYYTEGSYIITYYFSALKHSKVSKEKLEYRNKLNDK